MRNIFQIYIHDLKKIAHNWVALLVVGGVLVLPALYAWFNIAANIDPYSNTKNIKIAVANCDQGTENETVGTMNAGDKILEKLRKNDQLGWQIVSKKKALQGVRSGEYYAALIIPKDFSSDLVSVLSGKIESPRIQYYVNEKKNAIAPKVTDTGATTIQEQINETFVDVATKAVMQILKDSGLEAQGSLNEKLDKISTDLQSVESALQDQQNQLNDMISGRDGTDSRIAASREMLTQVKKTSHQGSKTIDDCQDSLSQLRSGVKSFSSGMLSSVAQAQSLLSDVNSSAGSDLSSLNSDLSSVEGEINGITGAGQTIAEANESELNRLEKLNNRLVELEKKQGIYDEQYDLSSKISDLKERNQNFSTLLDEIDGIASDFTSISGNLKSSQKTLSTDVKSAQKGLSSVQSSFASSVLPGMDTSLDLMNQHLSQLSSTMDQVDPVCDQLDTLLTQLSSTMDQTYQALQSTSDMLSRVNSSITSTEEDLNALHSALNYGTYADILTGNGIDSDKVADFISAPVELKTKSLYSVDNYGSGMTPFYTNLAIWVSGIILVSLFKMEVDKEEKERLSRKKKLTATESFFGRWLLFVTVGLLQSLVIAIGNLLFLHVQCRSIPLYFLSCLVISFVYVSLIYSLAITLKHIGKALVVLLVILQIPGSSGTFPIEMTPVFFQRLHMFLPFTYGVNAMREAMFGCYHHLFAKNLLILQIYLAFAIVFGLGVRALILNMNRLVDVRLERTGLFLYEESGMTRKKISLAKAIHVLASDEEMREQIYQRASRLDQRYQRMIRIGFFLVLLMPLGFLITSFVVDKSLKLTFLILMISSLVVICIFLIIVEYLRERLQEEINYVGSSSEELTASIKEELRS